MFPKRLSILGREYRIIREKSGHLGADVVGRVKVELQKIWIDRRSHKQRQKAVLLHEIIHVLDFHHGVDLDEKQTEALACGLYEFARRNRHVWCKFSR